MSKPGEQRPSREDFRYIHPIETRWSDNDVYGHVNNVVYYSYFDTAVNAYLIAECGLDIHAGRVIGLVVETGCRYYSALSYPEKLCVGVRVEHLGNSSVIYETAIFREGESQASASGRFVHVYVDRESRRPCPLPDDMRAGLKAILKVGA